MDPPPPLTPPYLEAFPSNPQFYQRPYSLIGHLHCLAETLQIAGQLHTPLLRLAARACSQSTAESTAATDFTASVSFGWSLPALHVELLATPDENLQQEWLICHQMAYLPGILAFFPSHFIHNPIPFKLIFFQFLYFWNFCLQPPFSQTQSFTDHLWSRDLHDLTFPQYRNLFCQSWHHASK